MNDINPSLRLSEDSLNAVIGTLQSIRERALSEFKSNFHVLVLY